MQKSLRIQNRGSLSPTVEKEPNEMKVVHLFIKALFEKIPYLPGSILCCLVLRKKD